MYSTHTLIIVTAERRRSKRLTNVHMRA